MISVTSDRPYHKALSKEEAPEEIKRGIGTQFDPIVANIFLKMPVADIIPEEA